MEQTWLVIISLFTIIIFICMYNPPPIREGLNIGKELKKTFEKPVKDLKKATTKEFNKAKKETTKGFNVIEKGTKKVGKDITKGVTKVFSKVTEIFEYIICGFNKIKTLPDCIFWYFLDIVYAVLYLFYLILATIIPPLKYAVKMLKKGFKMVEPFVNKITGINLFRYPDKVINKCYLCKPKKKKKNKNKKSKETDIPPPVSTETETSAFIWIAILFLLSFVSIGFYYYYYL